MGFASNLLRDVVGGFFGSDYLRDYTHAAKAFRTGSYANSPKNKFLFHVYFDINPLAYSVGLAEGANYGLEVKTVKLPSYNFTTHELNQYNRKRIIQTKIKYDPVDIAFHDDNGNMIRKLWENYYRYHFNDSLKPAVQLGSEFLNSSEGNANGPINNYNNRTQYTKQIDGDADWGYKGETTAASGVKVPFFKTINIFGFNQHRFVAYILVNPIITRFGHDTYSYAEGNGVMENTMTLDYETVVYSSGAISGDSPDEIAKGFGSSATYDRTMSPIAVPGSQNTFLGPSGYLSTVSGAIDKAAAGDIGAAIKALGTAATTAGSLANLKKTFAADMLAQAQWATNPQNRNAQFNFSRYDGTPLIPGSAPPLTNPPPT